MGRPRKNPLPDAPPPVDGQVPTAPAKVPDLTVFDRRILGNPFGDGSPAVRLKENGWTVRVVNTQLKPGRYHDIVRNKLWVPVLPDDLEGQAEDYGFDIKDGRVVRGERGIEVLVKMPTEQFRAIQMRKDAINQAQTSPRKLKQDVLAQTAAAHGDQAASYLEQNVTITDQRGPVPLEDPQA